LFSESIGHISLPESTSFFSLSSWEPLVC
jgi:hypothetical protein